MQIFDFNAPTEFASYMRVWQLFVEIWTAQCRRRYADEREHPEFVDLGGEA